MKIKTENGEEVEVYTAEEFDAKLKEATDGISKSVTEGFEAMKTGMTELRESTEKSITEAQAVINQRGQGDGDGQGAGAGAEGTQTPDVSAEIQKVRDEGKKEIDDFKKSMTEDARKEAFDLYTKDLSDEDKKKVEAEFDNYRPDDWTKTAITERMQTAVKLATGNDAKAPSALDNVGGEPSGAGAPNVQTPDASKEFSDDQKDLAAKMGIKPEELEAKSK